MLSSLTKAFTERLWPEKHSCFWHSSQKYVNQMSKHAAYQELIEYQLDAGVPFMLRYHETILRFQMWCILFHEHNMLNISQGHWTLIYMLLIKYLIAAHHLLHKEESRWRKLFSSSCSFFLLFVFSFRYSFIVLCKI